MTAGVSKDFLMKRFPDVVDRATLQLSQAPRPFPLLPYGSLSGSIPELPTEKVCARASCFWAAFRTRETAVEWTLRTPVFFRKEQQFLVAWTGKLRARRKIHARHKLQGLADFCPVERNSNIGAAGKHWWWHC